MDDKPLQLTYEFKTYKPETKWTKDLFKERLEDIREGFSKRNNTNYEMTDVELLHESFVSKEDQYFADGVGFISTSQVHLQILIFI